MPNSGDLLDANVWLALVVDGHPGHARAREFWETEATMPCAFCRITLLALMRHLTNPAIMAEDVLTPAAAWEKRGELLALPEVQLLGEPAGLDDSLGGWCNLGRTSPNLWTDAYLASFARCSKLRLVTFDQDFSRFTGLNLLILKGA
jgi:toxin-antitoxin system PIN domain toxin